jgi:hypothetical protein
MPLAAFFSIKYHATVIALPPLAGALLFVVEDLIE